jgi:spore maturation protein CgeB
MRAEWLRELTPDWRWEWLDTDPPLLDTSRVSRSIAYRFYEGPAVNAINAAVSTWLASRSFDLAWVDKAVFLQRETVSALRVKSRRLVHFTPDTAFYANRSRHFFATLRMFDVLVTTKSFEAELYAERGAAHLMYLATQGFDPSVHFPRAEAAQKTKAVAFVGLAEKSRASVIAALLDSGITVRLAGSGWRSFVRRMRSSNLLNFEGNAVFGDAYARLLSECWVGLGLLSKRFPELHTTRTFEIPACGSILATERNSETTALFDDSEALFFDDATDLTRKIRELFEDGASTRLSELAMRGNQRVISDHRDYPAILSKVLADPRIS